MAESPGWAKLWDHTLDLGRECTYELTNYSFIFNEAETFGGAIYTRNLQHEYLTRCIFDTNTVRSQSGGGRSLRIYREPKLVVTIHISRMV